MSAQDTLSRIVEKEAKKLETLSAASTEPLPGPSLEALEVLARCAKYLRAPIAQPKDDGPPGEPTAADLEAASG